MSRGTLDPALLTRLSLTGLSPSLAGFPKTILLNLSDQLRGPNPGMHAFRFGLFQFRSPLLSESFGYFLFVLLLRCFSSQAFLLIDYVFIYGLQGFNLVGFPHSDFFGSRSFSNSPKLIAALHVLRRLSVPRHSPLALSSFT